MQLCETLRSLLASAVSLAVRPLCVLDPHLDPLRQPRVVVPELRRLTGLIRVYVRDGGDPFALPTGSTVLDVAAGIHSHLVHEFRGARVWGPSARFEGQRVGRDYVVLEGDTIAVLTG